MSEWRDIKEYPLPKEHGRFLVFDGEDVSTIYRYQVKGSHWSQGYACECHEGSEPFGITHWMPLPKPPEEYKGYGKKAIVKEDGLLYCEDGTIWDLNNPIEKDDEC